MNAPTKTIETPIGKVKVEMKEWITGRDREYIDGSFLSGIDARPRMHGKEVSMNMEKLDMEKLTNSAIHRAIEKFVVSVDGKTENVVDAVLDLHEDDTAFILKTIDDSSKKKAETPSM